MEQGRWPKGLGRWSIPLVALAAFGCGDGATVAEPPVPQTDAGSPTNAEVPVMGPERRILAFGDSLFAGYNLQKSNSYPAKLEAAMRAKGINARVANAGVSGDTSAAGMQRFAFTLDNMAQPPELLILELGGNDLLRGISPEQTRANLRAIVEQAKARDIDVLLMGMRAPPNMGADFVAEFNDLYADLAREFGLDFIPFWVEPVADRPELIQRDRIHPTAEGVELLVTETLDEIIAALPKD